MIGIRAAHSSDAGAIAAIYAAEVTGGTASFELEPPGVCDMLARMAASGGRHPWLVAERGGTITGYAYAAAFHPRPAYATTAETSVYVTATARGEGVGRRLYAALLDALATDGYAQAIARIALPNQGSVALHEALAFRAAGVLRSVGFKQDRWVDVGFWQRALVAADQSSPVPR